MKIDDNGTFKVGDIIAEICGSLGEMIVTSVGKDVYIVASASMGRSGFVSKRHAEKNFIKTGSVYGRKET